MITGFPLVLPPQSFRSRSKKIQIAGTASPLPGLFVGLYW
jgi:hypothetical protein